MRVWPIAGALLTILLSGCRTHRTPAKPAPSSAPAPTSIPATAPARQPAQPANQPPKTYSNKDAGISIAYPGEFEARQSSDYVLLVVPRGTSATDPSRLPPRYLSLDIPKLPFHVPGMIPMGATRQGYLDDLRKQVSPLTTEDLKPPPIPDAQARLLRSTSKPPAPPFAETALILVHGDHVYIVRATTNTPPDDELRRAFDAMVQSLRWAK